MGILPSDFHGHLSLANPVVYVPIVQYPSLNEGRNEFDRRGASWFLVLGLLRPDATVRQADAAVSTVFQRLEEEYPETNARRTASARAFGSLPAVVRGPVMIFIGTLLAFVGLLLIITCANVAGMFLARANARRKEIAIRVSLGSGRNRLLRHILTESLLVFGMGGLGGILLAGWGLRLASSLELPGPFPINLDLGLDGRVLGFALLITLATGVIFGLLPARQVVDLDLVETLKDEAARPRSSEGRLWMGFVAAQVAASLVLLVGAGLLLEALQHAGKIERGFEARGAYLTFLDLTTEGFDAVKGAAFQDRILQRFSGLSWVESAALSNDLPLDMASRGTGVVPEGWEGSDGREYLGVGFNYVSPGYFPTLRIPILEGRAFGAGDRGDAELSLVVRTQAGREMAIREIPQNLRALEPNISLAPVMDLEGYTAVGILPQRLAGIFSKSLGALALLLSGMGIYGVMAYMVARRTLEMGIRLALGADPGKVLISILSAAARLALPGLAVGIVLSTAVAFLLRSLLLGVSPLDPVALVGVAFLVAGMVAGGTLVPAMRAARVDPAEALRYD